MTCTEALDLLLEADPAVLAETSESPVALHLRSCEPCRLLAARLVSGHERDRAGYLGVVSQQSADTIAARVIMAAAPTPIVPIRRRSLRRVALGIVPVAAAAAFVLLVNARRNARHAEFQESIDAAFAASTAVTNVKVPPGRNAVVFKTRDPGISVVWIY